MTKKKSPKESPERLTKEDQEQVVWAIENDGLDYAFRSYSSFEKVKNLRFHQLRKAFVEVANNLEEFVYEGWVPPDENEIEDD